MTEIIVRNRNKQIYIYDNSNPITDSFKLGKYWDESKYDIFKKYRRPNSNFIDAGAYIGTTSLLMYDILKDNKENNLIYSFEPINYILCEKNIIINNVADTIKLYKFGLGSLNCNVDIWNKDTFTVGYPGQTIVHLYGISNESDIKDVDSFSSETGNIIIRTLDSFNFSNIGFIKIDCEGMEISVLRGSIETIKNNNIPPLLIEIWRADGWRANLDVYKNNKFSEDIFNFLKECGYTKFIQIDYDDYICLTEYDYNRTMNL